MPHVDIADKTTLDKIYNIIAASQGVFGFIEHMATLAPSQRIEYIGANANYRPISLNKSTGEMSLNDWLDFPIIKANKPYMVNSDGTPAYRLDENNYSLKEDGTASDVANTAFDGGAFSWLKKVYKYESMEGNDRIVKFSFEKRDGFEPVGFLDGDNNELEGLWIPMFYGSIVETKMKSISGVQPCYSNNTTAEKAAIDAFGARARFFGGPVINVITDLLMMFAKTSDIPGAYGNGNMSGYDASLAPTNGVKLNAVIGGGQFYGTGDGRSLNKIFHSIVLGSWQQWMRDPYTVCVNGKMKVSLNYNYDISGASYLDTGVNYNKEEITNGNWYYPHRYKTVPGFGAIPDYPFKGSTSLGGCDGFIVNKGITAVALRFGGCDHGAVGGVRALDVNVAASPADWGFGAAILLLPPVSVAA